MILKREVKNLLGKPVKFLKYEPTVVKGSSSVKECHTGVLTAIDGDDAIVEDDYGISYEIPVSDLFNMEDDVPNMADPKCEDILREMAVKKYMDTIHNTDDLVTFPAIYDIHKDMYAGEAYKRMAKELMGTEI